jgi:hypothetical protein
VLEDLKNNNPAQVIVAFSGHSFDLSKNKFWELADEKLSKPTPFIGTQKIIDNLIEKTFTIEYHISKLKKVLNDNNLSDQIAKLENLFVQFKEKNGEPDWIKELEFLSLKSGEKQKIASIFKKLFSIDLSSKIILPKSGFSGFPDVLNLDKKKTYSKVKNLLKLEKNKNYYNFEQKNQRRDLNWKIANTEMFLNEFN